MILVLTFRKDLLKAATTEIYRPVRKKLKCLVTDEPSVVEKYAELWALTLTHT